LLLSTTATDDECDNDEDDNEAAEANEKVDKETVGDDAVFNCRFCLKESKK
jgi:hypothetical protein